MIIKKATLGFVVSKRCGEKMANTLPKSNALRECWMPDYVMLAKTLWNFFVANLPLLQHLLIINELSGADWVQK